MKTMYFTEAVDDAIAQAMIQDPRIILLGEDVPLLRRNLLARFGPLSLSGHPVEADMETGGSMNNPYGAGWPTFPD